MIRAKFTQVLALLLCAGLWACDGGGSGGGDGGTGGGAGGTGGGGSGGSNPSECGNGIEEFGEECDDGNTTPGDGCDASCDEENGACDDKIDYRAEATYDPATGLRRLIGTIEKRDESMIEGSCGGDGQEVVFSFMTDRKGILIYLVANAEWTAYAPNLAAYALTSCSPDAELGCIEPQNEGQILVEEPGEILLVVDAVETITADQDFTLGTVFIPVKGPGESCDPDGQDNVCDTGYVCKGTPPTCQEGTAPVIEKGATYFGADPSYIIAAGQDVEEDVVGFQMEPLDAAGNPMQIMDLDGDGVAESSSVYIDNAALYNATFGMMGFFGHGDGTWDCVVPTYWSALGFSLWEPTTNVPQMRLTLRDAAGLMSEPFVFGPPVNANLGEACDNGGFVVCGQGLVCKGDPSVCVEGTSPVITRTLFADRGEDRGGPIVMIEGTDPDDDVAFVRLETLDENGAPKAYDLNEDGTLDEMQYELAVNSAGGLFSGGWLLPVGIPQVALTAVDYTDRSSDRVIVIVAPAVWQQVGQACDTTGWMTCDLGLKCEGEPAACVQGTAPVIEGGAFAEDAEGPRLMILVADPDDDVTLVQMTMLDAAGNPTQYDIFGDGELWGPVLDLPIADYPFECANGYCFTDFILIDGFLGIPGLSFQAFDETGLSSAMYPVTYGPLPTRAAGEACSTWGFDVCAAGTTCTGTPATCQ